MYRNLSEKQQEQYKQEYKKKTEEYNALQKEFYEKNPELKKRKKRVANERSKADAKPETYMTPFKIFYQEIKEENENFSKLEAQKLYKNLNDKKKLEYINKLIAFDTDIDKKFSESEKKIMKYSTGELPPPTTAYNAYMKDKAPTLVNVANTEKMKKVSF
jgi:hypothetical protein